MLKETPVTKSYVKTEGGAEYELEYYIFSYSAQNDIADYGITIKEHSADVTVSESVTVSKNKEDIIKLVYCFAKNFVFPCSLHELIADMG